MSILAKLQARKEGAANLVGQDQECRIGVEERLVSQQEGCILVVATTDLPLASTRVQQRVVHSGVIVGADATRPGAVSEQPSLRILPGQPLDLHSYSCQLWP